MTYALLCIHRPETAPTLAADLAAAGILVRATLHDCNKLVQAAVLHAPDVVICDVPLPTRAWFQALQTLDQTMPCATIMLTHDADAAHITQSVECGVHVYVVNGYGANRLRSLIHLAQARHLMAQQQRRAFEEVTTRFEERKAVDRAKGILMRAQSLSDEDAFRALRTAAMNSNQRMGQLSQHVILSAQIAEGVNRAGQLRMLSQRLVKLYLLQAAGVQVERHDLLMQESMHRVNDNLVLLRKNLSQPTYGDLLEQLSQTWEQLKSVLAQGDTATVYEAAEALLLGADRLTTILENSGAAAPLRVLNLAGRQRMLSQRFAKYALLAASSAQESEASRIALQGMRDVQQEFEAALTYLNGLPLSTPEIHVALGAAGVTWMQMLEAGKWVQRSSLAQRSARMGELAAASESLLGLFEQLSVHYEHSMQMLVG